MEIFSEHKTEWIIGIICTFLPAIVGVIIKKTAKIPDVSIPFWLFCLMLGLIPAFFAVKAYSNKPKDIANKSYGVERVIVDGKHFVNCTFDGTELVFTGKLPFKFSKNSLARVRITFEGNASLTTQTLVAMYADEAFRPIVDVALDDIKKQGLKRSTNKN